MNNSSLNRPDKIWRLRNQSSQMQHHLARELDVSLITAQLLINRGLYTVEQCRAFFNCSLEQTHDPYLMRDMDKAVSRIDLAVRKREKILIYGDYDTDGITATALLIQVLNRLGGLVEYYIPHRIKEGYGLHIAALERFRAGQISLVITVDCGVSAFNEAAWCTEQGLDLIITDHHEPSDQLPEALAILNPKRADCGYPFKGLAGVGVAMKLAQALLEHYGLDKCAWHDYIYLCCLGAIADVVPLLGENRVLVKHGLEQLSLSQRPGLLALKEICGIKAPLKARDVSFLLTPRLNAAGRVAQADIALRLLLTDDLAEAREIAEELQAGNNVRQEIGANIYAEALGIIDGQPDLAESKVLVLASPRWHQGVLGIVAARLAERFYRPVFLIALDGDAGKGSARSIPGFNLFDAVESCREYLLNYGGHAQASGITIQKDRVADFSAAINRYAGEVFTQSVISPGLDIDVMVQLNQITEELLSEIECLQPFGQDNQPPLLACRGARVLSCRGVGREAAHLKMQVQANERQLDSIGFNFGVLAGSLSPGNSVDLAFIPGANEYNGQRRLQLEIKDVGMPAAIKIPDTFSNAAGVSGERIANWPEYIGALLYGREMSGAAFGESIAALSGGVVPEIIDGRKWTNRLDWLAKLAAEGEQMLILAGGAGQAVELAYFLTQSCPSLADGICGLFNPAAPNQIADCSKRFTGGDLRLLITAPGPAAALRIKFKRVVLFYPPDNQEALRTALALAEPSGSFFLCYNKDDLDDIKYRLNDLPPERDLLVKLYTLLRRNAGGNKPMVLDPEKTARWLATNLGKPVRDYSVHAAILILADLNLIEAVKQDDVFMINLLPPPPEKKDLSAAPIHQKLQKTRADTVAWMESLYRMPVN